MAEATAAIASATIAGCVAMCNANPEFWVKLLEMFSSSKDEQEASDILKKAVAVLVCQKNSYRLWVQTVQEIEEEAKKLLEERNKGGGEISVKEIQKLGKRIGEHKEAGNKLEGNLFDYPKPEPVVRKNGTPGIKKYPTLHKPLEEILVFLRDDKVYKIGILGPLGIGKTTIMENLNNHEQVAKLFDIVIWVKASTDDSKGSSSMECMRKVIEQRLNLNFEANTNPEDIRKAISTTLSRKKYLLLLDDVKDSLDLEEIGIPENRNGSSKVVLTTRIGYVSKRVDQVIKVNCLSKDEAWEMFRVVMNRPKLIKDKTMGPIAWRVCNDCYGLPLLLDKVASTFSQKDNEKFWVEGLNTWRKWPEKDRQGLEELYILFRFCYDSLNDERHKKCFLYAALYPEDSEIYFDYLRECWAAEDLLSKDGDKMENQLIYAYSVLYTLKNVSLLEEGKTENHVTMHKFTRQVALYIMENDSEFKHLVRTNGGLRDPPDVKLWLDKKRISLGENKLCRLPKSPDCKDLSTLFLQKNLSLEEIPGAFFEFMKNLRVLDLSHTGIMSLPPSLLSLIKLKILYLNNCTHLKDLPTDITRLADLEALDLRGSGIVNIPDYIGNLINLRRLRVSFAETGNANSTKRDQFNHDILSKLSKLEELVICVKTPDRLSNEVVGNITTSVAPLKNFKSLKFIMSDKVVYYIDIAEPTLRILLPKIEFFLRFLQKSGRNVREIKSFLFIISSRSVEDLKVVDFRICNKYVKYCNGEGIEFPTEVLREADAFELVEHKDIKQLSDIDIASMEKIRCCLVESCDAFETVVNATNEVVLPNLEHLCLEKLPKLRSICEGSLRSGTLRRIKTLVFISCPLLTVIFPSGVIEQLGEIKHLTVEDCPKVEKLFTTVASSYVLPELRKLKLLGLPILTKVYETNALIWPSLKKVKISKCPKLKTLHFNEKNAPELEQIKGEQQWWNSIECQNEENKKLQKLFIPSTSSELESNLSKKGKVQEHSEYQLEEDSPQKSKVHEHSKHPLKDKHVQLEDPGFEVSPHRSKAHEHSKQVYTGFQDTAVGYNHPDEGSSTKLSGFHGKDDSIPSTSLEAGEEERVMEQELDLVETSSSKIYDDHTLDLSYKSITSLPKDISKYVAIRELKLKGCQLLMELGPEIGELLNLELLDLEGTEIICLPKEIAKLVNLRSLKFSLYGYADQFQKTKRIKGPIIPQKALSNLLKLNELSIDVTPDGDWWNAEVKTVIDDLHCLQELKTLCLYIPTVYLFSYLVQNIKLLIDQDHACFRFTVGYHEERLTSRLPQEVLKEFHDSEKFKKGLKFTNGEEMPTEIKDALEHVDAFLLERHWSIKNLLEFGQKNTDKLKCCILSECNELQTLVDTKQCMDYDGAILGSLQHLSIHYMKSLQKIWRGPVTKGSLSNLKSLALHTCVSLTTVFKIDMLANLVNLEELRIEDCPKIKTLASSNYSDLTARVFLPKLKSMLLLELPNLRCISSGLAIAPKLQRLVIFYCLKLRKLSKTEISSKDLKVLKGEKGWWDALKWYESDVSEADQNYLTDKFVPLKEDGDLEEQFLRD